MSTRKGSRNYALLSALAVGFLWTHVLFTDASAKLVDEMKQGFLFDWSGDQSPPIPIAAQCDILHITWGRRSATGPNPVAPYYLQIYTSAFIVPFVIPAGSGQSFDWPLPFVPGTQFQMCMMASNGVSGGCQDVYTIYQRPNTSINDPPICQNLTYPHGALDVTPKTADGSWSQYGWIDQCTDIFITPNNGTPPYTYTISPALRPPFNFTSDTKDTVDWTVQLAYGLPFWVTVVDSTNSTWTNGPLHASGGGTTACLSQSASDSLNDSNDQGVSTGGVVGVGVGALILGIVAGTLGAIFFFRRRGQRYSPVGGVALRRKSLEPLDGSTFAFNQPPSSSASGSFPRHRGHGDIDPYIISPDETSHHLTYTPNSAEFSSTAPLPLTNPDLNAAGRPPPSPLHERSHSQPHSPSHTYSASSSTLPSASSPTNTMPRSPGGGAQHVYVVHHDGGRPPPVTVFTSDGTEVVELPPQYDSAAEARRGDALPGSAGNSTSLGEGQRRQPRGLPAKQPRSSVQRSSS